MHAYLFDGLQHLGETYCAAKEQFGCMPTCLMVYSILMETHYLDETHYAAKEQFQEARARLLE